jgi:hypothetical protein
MAAHTTWANDARIRRDFRGWKGRGHRFGDWRHWRPSKHGLPWSSEDHLEQRSGNVDPNHRTMTIAENVT